MRLLVVNAGSSSLKLQVLGPGDETVAERHVGGWDGEDTGPLIELVGATGAVDAVGHRVVHGGRDLVTACRIDDAVVHRIDELTSLAPLHQARSLAGIRAARAALPDVPHVACFDTAYHASLPEAAATYALPAVWRLRWPVRRYGFHGLSHAYAARRAGELLGGDVPRVLTCHLGAGASLCASLRDRSVDTTMGFTPLEGLVMATRSGTVDPGLVLWLITEAGLAPEAVRDGLEHHSGLLGLSGTADMRDVVAEKGLGFDVYVHSLARHAAGMVVALGGLDALVFTGGVGENAPAVRAAVADRLAHLGTTVDPARNDPGPDPDGPVSSPTSPVPVLVVAAREDLEIARQTRELLAS
jgi:acetate kinase